jgi:hypothetical protein
MFDKNDFLINRYMLSLFSALQQNTTIFSDFIATKSGFIRYFVYLCSPICYLTPLFYADNKVF